MQLADIFLIGRIGEELLHFQRYGNGTGICEVAIVEPRADDHVGDPALVGSAEAGGVQGCIDGRQVVERDVGQDQVLRMADADISVPVLFGKVCHDLHLLVGRIARCNADRLEADRDRSIAGRLVRMQVSPRPAREGRIGGLRGFQQFRVGRLGRQGRRRKIGVDAVNLRLRQIDLLGVPLRRKLFLDLADVLRFAEFRDEDLDARLVLVVPAAIAVVNPHDRLKVVEDLRLRDERVDQRRDMRRASLPAADMHFEANLVAALADMQADIVHAYGGAVMLGCRHRDLELARQEGELRMEGRPLADDLAPGARIHHLVLRRPGKMIRGRIADAVARGLDGVHLDFGELRQHVGNVLQRDPVELDVLARREVAETLVIVTRNLGEAAQLDRRELAIGNRNAQHVGMQLQVHTVLQAQRLELVLGQRAGQAPRDLAAELSHPLRHQTGVKLIIPVHASPRASAEGQVPARIARPRHAPQENHQDRTRLHARGAYRQGAPHRRAKSRRRRQ